MDESEPYSIRKGTFVRPGDRVWVVRDRQRPQQADLMFYAGISCSDFVKIHPNKEPAVRGEYTEHVWDRSVFLSRQHAIRELSR